jgi:CRISPR-associated protein Csm2
MRGRIRNIDQAKKFGFIDCNISNGVYFNPKSLCDGVVFQELTKNMELEFDTEDTERGPRAINCRVPENTSIAFFKEHVLDLSENKAQYDNFCDCAKEYADRLKTGNVTTSMIRKIYARVLHARSIAEIKLLRPHFAYTAGRNENNHILGEFMDLLDYLVKKMDANNEQHLNDFKQFMEAIVAYRKYVGNDK